MKAAIRKLAAEWDQFLHLPDGNYWKLEDVKDPRSFFRHLPAIFPHGMTLLFEGLEIGLSAKALYEEHPAAYRKKVVCDTLSPTPDSYHVAFGADFADRLCRLIESQGLASAFYHLKGYSEGEIVFTFHDAFEGELILSGRLTETAVREFAAGVGRSAKRAAFAVNQRQQIMALDRALNPPWWRRVLGIFASKPEPSEPEQGTGS